MSEEQRKRAIQKFHSASVREVRIPSTSTSQPLIHDNPPTLDAAASCCTQMSDSRSVPVEDVSKTCSLPKQCIEGIWQKASRLVSMGNAVVNPPGPPTKDRLVLSESSPIPHYVSVGSSPCCSYKCDKNCLNFSSMQICSHVMAAAEVNSELAAYISAFKKAKGKQPANMTCVAKRGLPSGAGRKGEKPAKKKQPRMELPEDSNRVPFIPQSKPPSASPSAGISPCGQQPLMNLYSPFGYFENMYVSPQLPAASQLPLFEVGTSGIELQPPFKLYMLTGNITTCYGCKVRFARTGPPYDLIVQHEEDRQFFNPKTGAPMCKRGNAYYHVYLPCIRMCWPSFDPHTQLVIPDFVREKL